MDPLLVQFSYENIAFKVTLACGVGLFVGLEREWAKKEIGVRTFAIASLLGMLTSLLSPMFVAIGVVGVLVLVTFLNVQSLLKDRSLELTTSMCLIVVTFLGVLVGMDHYFLAAASAIMVMMLLTWKIQLERFAGALKPEEIRSAVLLGLLSVVVFPILPNRFVDPWDLINPRQAWMTVILVAGIGFINYVLLRLYGMRGMFFSAILGGLVNSTATVTELATSFRKHPQPLHRAVSLLLLTNVSMFFRNVVILAVLSAKSMEVALGPIATMITVSLLGIWMSDGKKDEEPATPLQLSSPISVPRVIKFSLMFLMLACMGTLAQRQFGSTGFMVVGILGGLVSSASTTAMAATLAATGKIDPVTAGVATVLTSMTSAMVNLPLVYQETHDLKLARRILMVTALLVTLGVATVGGVYWQ